MTEITTFTSMGSMFEEMLGEINYENDEYAMGMYPFKVRVGMPYRRPPRHKMWEYLLEMGHPEIELVFAGESFNGKELLTFIFPERWMNVSEQRNFMWKLKKHPEAKTLKQVDIITHSPLMIGEFKSIMIRVLKWEDDILYEHEKDIKFSM